MYEKYSGLPDTTKSSQSNSNRVEDRPSRQTMYSNGGNGSMEYYQAPKRASGSGSSKRENARRAKIRKRRFILSLISLLFVGLVVVAVVVLVRSCSGPAPQVDLETGKFRSGVSVNWTDVSGKTVDEVRPLLESNLNDTISKISITLASGELNATISGADLNASSNLDEVLQQALSGGANQDYYSAISIDETALTTRLNDINATASAAPVDASFTVDFSGSGKPTFNYTDGKEGFGLDVASTIELVKQAIASNQLQTTLQPTLTAVQPSITKTDLMAHTTLIGKFTTTYDFKGTAEDTEDQRTIYIPNRAFNVEKGASMISGQVLKPGVDWSFNDTVGDRTEENGWKLAQGIFGGDRKTPQFGGGICQVSTTLYNAMLEAYPYFNFFDRSSHSIPSTYVPKGLDATVDSNHIDFQVKNVSEYPVYIFAYTGENKMAKSRKRDITVVIYGEALPEGVEYKTRTVLITEEPPLEEDAVITETSKLFIGEENILAEPHVKYVVDVYIDRYLNGELQESKFEHEDIYPGNPLKKQVGTMPTPTPVVDPTPTPNLEDLP